MVVIGVVMENPAQNPFRGLGDMTQSSEQLPALAGPTHNDRDEAGGNAQVAVGWCDDDGLQKKQRIRMGSPS